MFRILLDAGDSFSTVTHDPLGKDLTVHVDRPEIISHGVLVIGELLLRLHIYRCTADVVACRKRFEI